MLMVACLIAFQVEYIPKAKLSCLAKATAVPGDLIIYDDGLLGDLEEFSNVAQINGHLVFKGAGAKAGPGLGNLNGFKSLRVCFLKPTSIDIRKCCFLSFIVGGLICTIYEHSFC